VRRRLGAAVSAALISGLLAGCSDAPGGHDSPGQAPSGPAASRGAAAGKAPAGGAWQDEIKPATSAAKLGGSGTPCVLPVSFDLAPSWKAKPVADGGSGDPLAQQGGLTLKCEVDAKPAGHIGFLRVWSGGKAGDDPRKAVDGFLAGEKNIAERRDRATTAGALPAAEVTYAQSNPALGTSKRERILAVTTARGVVVLALGGLDADEHEQMLPAYLLAKQSLTATS
jgi:hypothetical protein